LENQHKRSIGRNAQGLKHIMPYVGHLQLSQVHMGTLDAYIDDRLQAGISQGTINRDLTTVRRILNLSARLWRDENGNPWLLTAPLIQMRDYEARKPYPLSFEEQRRLFEELAPHLARMALFKVNTGTRQQEVVNLRWDWEIQDHNAFLIPAGFVKNKLDRLVVCNSIAMAVINSQRGVHPERVFTYKQKPVTKMYNNAWKRARAKVGLPTLRVHDLKHTFGFRLRAAGVSFEDRQDLLGHKSQSITTDYSAPYIDRLMLAAEKVVDMRQEPSLRLVNQKSHPISTHDLSTFATQSGASR
jgi:integrase